MKALRVLAIISIFTLASALFAFAQGPVTQSSDTVAKKKKSADDSGTAAPDPDADKIPSKFSKKDNLPQGVPTFRTDALTVSVDVAVLDNNGHFIPKIPKGNFRFSKTMRRSR